jgi:hypothetical protein
MARSSLKWPAEIRAAVLAALAAGERPSHVAQRLGVGAGTVRRYKLEATRAGLAAALAPQGAGKPASGAAKDPPPPPMAPAAEVRLRDELARARRERDEALRTANRDEDMRRELWRLAPIPAPVLFTRPPASDPRAETVVVFASDWHFGDRIDLEKMDGLNSYTAAIAQARAGRLFSTVADLTTRHWAGPAPARLIIILGGDMISGEIHEELDKANELRSIDAAQHCASSIMGGLTCLLEALPGVPIEVITLPGNHGRTTRKPQSKFVNDSYDVHISNIVEAHFAATKERRIKFWAPVSGDAVFSVDGWVVLATHGDRIGSRGGQGFVGPAATAARGFKRLVADYATRGTIVDLVLCGHFHTPLRLEEGYVCGTLAGPSEYARDGRFRPHPASQLFLAIHPRRGVTQVREISVGAPDEGSIYQGREDRGTLRPRYRVPAISVPR